MKKIKVLSALAFLLVSFFPLVGCGETEDNCNHKYTIADEPTESRSGLYMCDYCFERKGHLTMPALNPNDYEMTVVDEDTTIYRYKLGEQEFVFYKSNFVYDRLWDESNQEGFTLQVYKGNKTEVTIPSVYAQMGIEYPVIAIGQDNGNNPLGAFENKTNIKKVNIPSSIKSIGHSAFNNCGIEEMVIPETVECIEDSAFEGCNSLKKITIPFVGAKSQYGPGRSEFAAIFGNDNGDSSKVPSSLKEVVITGGESLCDQAFRYCENIEKITLPETLKTIGSEAFSYCSNLKEINIPDSVTSIGPRAFSVCTSLESFAFPKEITNIDEYMFAGCSNLKSVFIPKSVTSIGAAAFANCESLQEVYYEGAVFGSINVNDYNQNGFNNEALLNAKVLTYAEECPSLEDYLYFGKSKWHYDENNKPVAWEYEIEYTNTLDGKTYVYSDTKVEISEEYWYMLEQAKAQNMLDEIFAEDPSGKELFLSSANKEEYGEKLASLSDSAYAGIEINFVDGKVTITQGDNTSLPMAYKEINGEYVYYTVQGVFAFKIVDGKIYEEYSSEFFTTTHIYSVAE